MTSAVAALDLEGNTVKLVSRREFPRHEMIEEIIETGTPVVMACDTAEMPSSVRELASSLGAERFSPERDLSSERKKSMGAGENSHEKDAMASARYAYNNLRRTIQKLCSRAESVEEPRHRLAREHFGREETLP